MNSDIRVQFFGAEFGLIVRDKLKEAGFQLLGPESTEVDLFVVGFYGKILSKQMLKIPKYGALNVHPSLLPKYRGPTPVPSAILNGEEETGVSVIQMDEEADHGPILAQQQFHIGEKQYTTPELRQALWELGGDLLVETIPKWIAGEITPKEQDHSKATYTPKLTRADGEIDWNKRAEYIARQIRAFDPWPGTYTFWQGKTLKILQARGVPWFRQGGIGTVSEFQGKPAIQTREGALLLERIQLEGRKSMPAHEFLLGHKDFLGSILG